MGIYLQLKTGIVVNHILYFTLFNNLLAPIPTPIYEVGLYV